MANAEIMLVQKSGHALSFYDMASGAETARIALGEYPHEFVVDADQAFAYVTHYGVHNSGIEGPGGQTIFIIDIARRELAGQIDCGEDGRPHGIAMDAAGGLYVLSERTDTLLYKLDPRAGGGFDHGIKTGGTKSHLFALTRDGRRAYSMNLVSNDVTVFDPHDASTAPVAVRTREKPEGRHLRADEKLLYVTNRLSNCVSVIDTASLSITGEFPTPNDPVRIYHDEKRDRLLTANFGASSVSVFDARDGREVHRIETPAAPIALSFAPGFQHALISVDCDRLWIVDMDTMATVSEIETLAEPDVSHVLR